MVHLTFNKDADNMALLPTGDLLLSSKGKLLTLSHTTGKTEDFKCEQSLENITKALHVTKDNKIMVGRVNNNTWQPEVLVMDMTGHLETVYYHDTSKSSPFAWIKNTSIFTDPIRVTSDSCHNVYVIDVQYGTTNRVVVLGQAGEVRGIYSGCNTFPHNLKISIIFNPVDLVVTELDNVIVLDSFSGLHVINSEGKCIKCQKFSDLGIEVALSLDIDNNGMLLMGSGRKFGNCNNDAKIHVLKFSVI